MTKRFVIAWLSGLVLFVTLGVAGTIGEQDEPGRSRRGWLGVAIRDITPELRRSMDLKSSDGALVSEVLEESPAESAGIKEGDVIVRFGGKEILDAEDLQRAVRGTAPGTAVDAVVVRKGEQKTIQVKIGRVPRSRSYDFLRPPLPPRVTIFGRSGTYGLQLQELNDQMAEYLSVPDRKGVVVWEVRKETPAERAGFRAGDVIVRIGKRKIAEIRDIRRALGGYDPGEKVDVEVIRKGSLKTIPLTIEEEEFGWEHEFWLQEGPRIRRFHGMRIPEFEIRIPEIDLEWLGPRLDHLHHDLERLKDDLRFRFERGFTPRARVRVVVES